MRGRRKRRLLKNSGQWVAEDEPAIEPSERCEVDIMADPQCQLAGISDMGCELTLMHICDFLGTFDRYTWLRRLEEASAALEYWTPGVSRVGRSLIEQK